MDRLELEKCLEPLEEGNPLVVWRLDRLGRSLRDLLEIVSRFWKAVRHLGLAQGALRHGTACRPPYPSLAETGCSRQARFRQSFNSHVTSGYQLPRPRDGASAKPALHSSHEETKTSRTLVLMRCSGEEDRAVFAGDLYFGQSLEVSVYYDRAAMLDWLCLIDPTVEFKAARALSELLASPDTRLHSIALNAPEPLVRL